MNIIYKADKDFGKVDVGRYHKYKVRINVEIRDKEERRSYENPNKRVSSYVISFYGDIYRSGNDWIEAGQINDTLREYIERDKFYGDKKLLLRVLRIWDKWHLNNMHVGTRKQENALMEKFYRIPAYIIACDYLKEIGLLEDRGYEYGTDWLMEKLPESVISEVKSIFGDDKNE